MLPYFNAGLRSTKFYSRFFMKPFVPMSVDEEVPRISTREHFDVRCGKVSLASDYSSDDYG
ncbi:MAG: hypothetical protein SXQ77_00795, partial [Halobacteria archaeon]|nr:hypothetical protein [Halobacteria archaeon]